MGVGEAGGVEPSPSWWQQAEKALLSANRGSHEWRCKQPRREGTFPLAESAVKRFPVTVIAAFGGIISVEAVGRGGKGRGGWQGKAQETSGLLARSWRPQPAASGSQVPDAQRLPVPGPLVFGQTCWASPFPPNGWSPDLSGPGGSRPLIPCCPCPDSLGYCF